MHWVLKLSYFDFLQCPAFKNHTAGLNVQYEPTKKYFLTNQRGYDKSETTDEKLSKRRIQICWVYFSAIIF